MSQEQFDPLPLAEGITESYIPTADLTYHVLSAGYPTNPLILLLHGFPELAYSWRKIMLPLALANYHVVAYDQRGYGRTTGWDTRPFAEVDLQTFQMTRLVVDAMRLVSALGYQQAECVIGHDFGAVGASLCALIRGDVFKSFASSSARPSQSTNLLKYNPHVPSLRRDAAISLS
jgi:pimeloyl-ACP methyl ester carboxylesterase